MELLTDILKNFEPISLKKMDAVQLMNRTDTKFIFPSNRMHALLVSAAEHYKILEINQQRDFPYHSTYMDTSRYLFFNQHMNSKPGRFKIRYRIYESTGASYLEIKCKTNKNRTVKWRMKNELTGSQPDQPAMEFLSSYISNVAAEINPVLVNRFNRITLAGLETRERITIDYNLSFSDGNGSVVELPYLAIAELKREGFTSKSHFLPILKKMQIRQSGFSKYCIGNALLRSMPKINILKPKLLMLQKIQHENAIYNA
jgi:hypothetical protein